MNEYLAYIFGLDLNESNKEDKEFTKMDFAEWWTDNLYSEVDYSRYWEWVKLMKNEKKSKKVV